MHGAVIRFIGEIEAAETAVKRGMQQDGMEAGIVRYSVDTRGVAVNPISDGAVSIMIVGIHAGIVPHLVAIPALPHGGGAVIDEVAPGWIFRVEQQAVSDIGVAGIGERG